MATDSGLSVLAWAQERHDNSVQIASTKTGGDRVGWLEDVTYWTAIIDALSENERLRIACASGWGEPVLVNTLRAERDAARAERDALMVRVDQWRQMADREVTAHVEMRAERDAARAEVAQARAERDGAVKGHWIEETCADCHNAFIIRPYHCVTCSSERLNTLELATTRAARVKAEAALTEARRVLGRIEWVRIGGKMQPYCPFCWEQAKDGHTADCALAAVLAQEEK